MNNDNYEIIENETSVQEGKWMFITFVAIMTVWVFFIIKQPFAYISYGICLLILCAIVFYNTSQDPRHAIRKK